MANKKKKTDDKNGYSVAPPETPSEPPELLSVCVCCKKKTGLKVFVVIEQELGWNPPHRFDTFCTKKCAKTWYDLVVDEQSPVKIVEYTKWPNRKEMQDGR